MSDQQRRIATDQHQRAIESINEMFDRLDHLTAARDQLSRIEALASGEDPVRDAESILGHADRLRTALDELRAAAVVASDHRRRTDLAADICTKTTALFPRASSRSDEPDRTTTSTGTSTQSGPPHEQAR